MVKKIQLSAHSRLGYSIWLGDRVFDFVDDPVHSTFGGIGGMEYATTTVSGPRHAEKGVPDCIALAPPSSKPCEQLVISGQDKSTEVKM